MEQALDDEHKFICPVEATISLIDGKWKPLIIWHLRGRRVRFNQLLQELSGVSPKMLTKQLRELERDGMVERTMFPEIPPRVEYSLTPMSRSFLSVLEAMGEWGTANLGHRLRCAEGSAKERRSDGDDPSD